MAIQTKTVEVIDILGQQEFTELAAGVYQIKSGEVLILSTDGITGILVTVAK